MILVIDEKNLYVNRGQTLKVNLVKVKNIIGDESAKIMIVISKAKPHSNYKGFILRVIKEDDSENSR